MTRCLLSMIVTALLNFSKVSPRHPLIYYALHHYILGVLGTTSIDFYSNISLYAINSAIEDFRRDAGTKFTEVGFGKTLPGTDGRTITLFDHKDDTGIFKNEGGWYMPRMPDFISSRSSMKHQMNWKESCMTAILSDLL